MLKYSTKKIEYLFSGQDTWIKKFLKKYFFKQNPFVATLYRAPGIKFRRTSKEQSEWDRCKNDIIYFAENYFYYHDINEDKIKLIVLRDYQKKILKSYVEKGTIVCSSRQMGITTLNRIYALWSLLFETKYIQIITEPMAAHVDFIKGLRLAYIRLPYYIQKGITRFNKNEIVCDDYSRVTDVRVKKLIKPEELKFFSIIIDNAAFLHSADLMDLERKLRQHVKCVITSTPNGYNLFTRLWQNANEKNAFNLNPIKVMWFENEKYDDTWAEKMIATIGQDKFDEEYNFKFRNKSK